MTATFIIAGLTVASEFQFPDLEPVPLMDREPDIRIRFGPIPEFWRNPRPGGQRFTVENGDILLSNPRVGRFRISKGTEVTIAPIDGADPNEIREHLLGTILGLLCHQRGLIPLHASAIAVDGGCVAFAGESGAGKSTLAGLLSRRGFPLVSDDICVVRVAADGSPEAYPGMCRLKLSAEALGYLGYDSIACDRYAIPSGKYELPMNDRFAIGSLPLRRVYLLNDRSPGFFAVREIKGAAAVDAISKHTFRLDIFNKCDESRRPQGLLQRATIARTVSIFELGRPDGLSDLERTVRQLELHMRVD